ncbi:hypothetical protein SAR06_004943 [Escherichia coli]|nr:hypothetical protein [Escherichia coli]
MNTYDKIYQKLIDNNDSPVIKGGASSCDLSIEEMAKKYNIDKEALERAIALSKSLKQGLL